MGETYKPNNQHEQLAEFMMALIKKQNQKPKETRKEKYQRYKDEMKQVYQTYYDKKKERDIEALLLKSRIKTKYPKRRPMSRKQQQYNRQKRKGRRK